MIADHSIGFIGLGRMGTPMARNLIRAGFNVIVHDSDPSKVAEFSPKVGKLDELSASCSRIITMLPSNDAVNNVYLKGALPESAKKGSVFIDCSTISPNVAINISKEYSQMGLNFIDAPVSGGVKGAQQATLSFLVGGDPAIVEKNRDLLLAMGKKIFLCGKSGSGQAAKICNNLILGVSMVSLSESLNLGIRLGLDPKILSEIINASSGRSWTSEFYNPMPGIIEGTPASDNYNGGFATKLMIKDLGLALEESRKSGAQLPTTTMAREIYERMLIEMNDLQEKDFSSVFKFIQSQQ